MRRPRAARPQPSMSLFPFLAVLICTMGVLIILLVLVTREANVNAEAKAQESAADRAARHRELEEARDQELFRSDMLADLQPDLQTRLNDARLRRSHLEDQIRELEEQAQKLRAQFNAIEQEPNSTALRESQRQLAALQQQIEDAERELESARQHVQHLQRSYAVVPYPGPNGTTRRPIYLECSSAGIRMQPHDILFTSRELHKPVLAGNPLDAALLAVREHWAKYGDKNEEPYPLLIVRPDGSNAYAMAREAMKSWDSEFGYELVDRDINLQFPGKDPELEALLHDVIDAAYERQEKLQQALTYRERMQAISNGDGEGAGGFASHGSQGGYASGTPGNGSGDTSGEGSDGGMTLRATHRRGGFVVEREGQGSRTIGSDDGDATLAQSDGKPAWEIDPFGNVRLRGSGDSQEGRDATADGTSSNSPRTPYGTDRSTGSPGQGNLAFNRPRQNNSGTPSGNESDANRRASDSSFPNGNLGQQGVAGNGSSAQAQQAAMGMTSLAKPRGENWALPSKSPQAIAYRKPIQLSCTQTLLTIYPGAYSNEPVRQVELRGATGDHLDELVDGVWRLIDSWGSAGYNAYWKPEIHVRVSPDGEQRFRELQALMDGSGIEFKRKSP